MIYLGTETIIVYSKPASMDDKNKKTEKEDKSKENKDKKKKDGAKEQELVIMEWKITSSKLYLALKNAKWIHLCRFLCR